MPTLNPDGFLTTDKRIQLLPYRPREALPRPLMTDDEIIAAVGGTLILDTESYSNFFLAGFKHVQSGKYIQLTGNFNHQFLSWLLFSFKTVGFNSLSFDLPLLWAAYVNRDSAFLKTVTNDLIFSGLRSNEIASKFGFKVYDLPERQHVDLFNVCPGKHSLKLYGARLHCQRLQDLPISEDAILTEDEKEIVTEYNGNDLDVTEQIFLFNMERLQLREHLSLEYCEDLMSKSDAQMAETIISKEVNRLTKRYIKRPEIEPGTSYKYKIPSYIGYETSDLKNMLTQIRSCDFVVSSNGSVDIPKELTSATIKIGGGVYRMGIGGLHSTETSVGYSVK